MQCNSYFQPFIDHLNLPATATGPAIPVLAVLGASNRAEANRFVSYMIGTLQLGESFQRAGTFPGGTPIGLEVQQLVNNFGACEMYFSDRLGSGGQPFDKNQIDLLDFSLVLPDGPLTLSAGGQTVARFSTLECEENGLLVCTSDLDRSILVLSFLPDEIGLEP